MKKEDPIATKKQREHLDRIHYPKIDARIGRYHAKLPEAQRKRFDRIVESLARKLSLKLNQCPLELILMRQIAMDTIRIEEAEAYLIENPDEKYKNTFEKFIDMRMKSRRDALKDLNLMTKTTSKKEEVDRFAELRNALRESEGLKGSKTDVKKDGHDRRHYDKVVRTKE